MCFTKLADYFMDVLSYFFFTVILAGYIGNFLIFKVFSSRGLSKFSMSVYFRAISVIDSFMLFNAFLEFLDQKFHFKVELVNDFFCKTIELCYLCNWSSITMDYGSNVD